MSMISVQCNHCGSLLDVNEGTNFCICANCKSTLQVKFSGTAYYSTVVDKEVSQVKDETNQALKQLDEEWAATCNKFEMRSRNGAVSLPSRGHARLGLILVSTLILVSLFAAVSLNMGALLLVALPLGGLGIWGVISAYNKLDEYQEAKQLYERKRKAIVDGLTSKEKE